MTKTSTLGTAKADKNDEFYTQFSDIQTEMNAFLEFDHNTFRDKVVLLPCDDPEWSNFTKFFAQNFDRLGLKKLISTSYAVESKKFKEYQPTLWEQESPLFDADKTRINGKIFILERDVDGNGHIDIDDLEFHYLEGDGDFRSAEVTRLRDEADIIITNPPFSLFREFLTWILSANKQFAIIGNMNAYTYKEVFPYIKNNLIWVDSPFVRGAGYFTTPYEVDKTTSYYNSHDYRENFIRVPGVRWFMNIDIGRRHEPLKLMSMKDNLRYSKHKEIKERGYLHYENIDAIDVPFTDAIPDDYYGIMGVPKTFLDKYCPEQFEIIGNPHGDAGIALGLKPYDRKLKAINPGLRDGDPYYILDGQPVVPFSRLLIRKKQ